MARRKQKQYLIGNGSRTQLGLGRRSMFVSQEKQAQAQAARKLKLWSRVVAVIAVTGILCVAGLFLWFYMIPYFHQELITAQQAQTSGIQPDLPDYDELGLPIYSDDINLFTINSSNPDSGYAPEKLTSVESVQVDARISDSVRQLCAAAKDEGFILIFSDGYVSYEEQSKRFDALVSDLIKQDDRTTIMAKTEARAQVPAAGESDMQTGLCLRLAVDKETFSQSKTYSWLRNNMGRYGFVFRYPEDKTDYTGLDPDLTVLRYVGGKNAAAMQQRSMCLEEYIAYLDNQ